MAKKKEEQGMTCPLTGVPVCRIITLTIAAFIAIAASNYVIHVMYMMPQYEATAALWRDKAGMEAFSQYMHIGNALLALGIAGLYALSCCKTESCGACTKSSLVFGLFLGLALGAPCFASIAWLPIPMEMATSWLITSIGQGLFIGFVLSLVCKTCKKK